MEGTHKTVIYDRHVSLGAQMVEFGGWDMPLQYASGIIREHLATRRHAGLFDVSHMGRFALRGGNALALLQRALSNNAAGLEVGESQYTMIPDAAGGAVDDAYLSRFFQDEYLLVVNAANRRKDWDHLQAQAVDFPGVEMRDRTLDLAMFSLQGPLSKKILQAALNGGALPEPIRNRLSTARAGSAPLLISRTGYTGEPLCFEMFVERAEALGLWDRLTALGAEPVGLGARDTLRLEAGLPLYGHELGTDPEGQAIPIFACALARFAVSLSPLKAPGQFLLCEPVEGFSERRQGEEGVFRPQAVVVGVDLVPRHARGIMINLLQHAVHDPPPEKEFREVRRARQIRQANRQGEFVGEPGRIDEDQGAHLVRVVDGHVPGNGPAQ